MIEQKRELFKNIERFETNSDLFINFAFFRFIELLGKPLIDKISKTTYTSDFNSFFNNLKFKCEFEEKGKDEVYLNIKCDDNSDMADFSPYIYSELHIHGSIISLNGREDRYDSNSKKPKIKLSKNTVKAIRRSGCPGKRYKDCELYFDNNKNLSDPKLTSLINLYLNNRDYDKSNYIEKKNSFVKKVSQDPKYSLNDDIFEIDENGDNRIKYENLQKGEIYFIQGPPGTGKTTTINRIIRDNDDYDKRVFNKIIIASHVHVAINNIVERILHDNNFSFEDRYHKLYDLYQYLTVLYSDRAYSSIEDSPESILIELDTLIDLGENEIAEKIYRNRKTKSKELIDDFDKKIDSLDQGSFKENIEYLNNWKEKVIGEKFKRIFNELNNSDEDNIDYEQAVKLMNELNDKFNSDFIKGELIDWGIANYSEAIKNYSNVIFCSLDKLHKELSELDIQKDSDRILVIIDEASKSDIINYLLLLDKIDNITLLILGDPKQLNNSLVFHNNLKIYSRIMAAFYKTKLKEDLKKCKHKSNIIYTLKSILFKIEKNKYNRETDNKGNELGYYYFEKTDSDLKMWEDILSETFYETLFDSASQKRKKLLNIHRRSRNEIFELSKFLYGPTYILGEVNHDDNLLVPNYDVVTKIVIKDFNDGAEKIKDIISDWKKQKNKVDSKMNMGIITFYNTYKNELKAKLDIIDNNDISLYTVDSSQGEEFTTVILYLDVNPNDEITKFAMNYHRINVAVSRAREQLFILVTKAFIEEYNKIQKSKNNIIDENTKTFIDKIIRGDSNA